MKRWLATAVLTAVIAEALMQYESINESNIEEFKEKLIDVMHEIGGHYPRCGFGGRFRIWMFLKERNANAKY